jgi:uncharacterized protein YuzE
MRNFEYDYDKDNDDLFMYKKDAKSTGAVELGNVVLDFDYTGDLVAIQIMHASKFLTEATTKTISRTALQGIKECKADMVRVRNQAIIRFVLFIKEEPITHSIAIPAITRPSPALCTTG